MNVDKINILQEKAKTRKDGVYKYGNDLYLVSKNKFIAFADYDGNIVLRQNSFNYTVGKVEARERKTALLHILKAEDD